MPRSGPSASTSEASSSLVLAGDRPADAVVFERATVDFFVNAADLLGVPKSVAAIYGIVFASPVPVSFADIEARLDISKGSISQGLRVLREMGALMEVSSASDRAELFSPELEMRKLIGRFLENRLQKQLDGGSSRLVGLKKSAAAFPPKTQKELLQRVKKLQQWHDRSRALLPLIRGFLKLTPG
jgi:DNA-binding transcriptional regulator GbsR (MarR family)